MTIKLVQPVAIRVELIRSNGFSTEELLIHLQNSDLTPFQQINGGEVDFSILLEYAQTNMEDLKQALTQGYQATFLTVPGVKNFLAARYHIQAGRDYEDHGESFENLQLPAEEVQFLTSTLSQNWAVQQTGDTIRIQMVR
ncbi:hypothetical protein [Tumebacillus permanentifrigoris]|uniref:Uncharacterized protein n=1 Tax=Tumebacillus permanentifrigoris TaxID=378543 RepID=A0A316D8J4_9BACL|nr:hypothetical protein [Tumebacillus permanentifrigoris]PWK13179.1 hypothetical protein C7459_108200 [Tumebacillus permanentifrigoris]